MRYRTSISFAAIWLAPACALAGQIMLTTLAKGPQSAQDTARNVTIHNAAEWKTLWKTHAPADEMPAVDFAKSMVVGVFLGTKPSGGYDVEIVGVRVEDKDLVVEYAQKQPAPGTMVAQVLTSPFHLVSVPKHTGTVRFQQK